MGVSLSQLNKVSCWVWVLLSLLLPSMHYGLQSPLVLHSVQYGNQSFGQMVFFNVCSTLNFMISCTLNSGMLFILSCLSPSSRLLLHVVWHLLGRCWVGGSILYIGSVSILMSGYGPESLEWDLLSDPTSTQLVEDF